MILLILFAYPTGCIWLANIVIYIVVCNAYDQVIVAKGEKNEGYKDGYGRF